ncbi:alpha/beta-hydrolase [Marasmius fiardii PR-910]|nr:alpha/beta-hydrolase [Marasmius fiardii PR-910]
MASPEAAVTITTTSGRLQGAVEDGVLSVKGVRFGLAPTGPLRWLPPVPFVSAAVQDATKLGPSCVQQFAFATANLIESLFNNPPPREDEDCLFLNVWAPSPVTLLKLKPVLFWIYGGSLAFGTGSLPAYDGTSFAKNQDIVVVNFNYRTNVFGFPTAPDLPLTGNNLGFLDQELALDWVRENIIQFGGDPNQITIMGQSAGSLSVAAAITRNQQGFRAGIMLSSALVDSANVPPDFTSFNDFSNAVNCTQSPGPARLACLKQVPAAVIRNFTNGPSSGAFSVIVDNQTFFRDPIERILAHETTRTPLMIGNTQNDSSLFVIGQTDLAEFLQTTFPGIPISADQVRSLYPGRTDVQVIGEFSTDLGLRCPVSLWAATMTLSGIRDVYRYSYGAVFPDTQLFPNAGAWHSSELPLIFGTFNRTTASNDEAVLSKSLQTTIANFVKDPSQPPAPNWNQYDPNQKTLAELAFNGNVNFDNFVNPVTSATEDGPCIAILALGLNPVV